MLDPTIAAGVKPIQLENPLEQYSRVLQIQGAQQTNALNKMKMDDAEREIAKQNALGAAYRAAYNPQTGETDWNKVKSSLATGGFGSHIPDIDKQIAETRKADLDQQKVFAEVVGERMKHSRLRLEGVTTPQQFLAWHEENHRDPILGRWFAERGVTAEQSRAKIMQTAQNPAAFAQLLRESKLGAEKALERHMTEIDSGGKVELVSTNKFGEADPKVVMSRNVTPSPNVKGTTVNIDLAENGLKKKGSELAADGNRVLFDNANKSPDMIERSRFIRNLVSDPKTFVGPLAEVKLKIARSLDLFADGQEDSIRNTELLMSQLAKGVFEQINELGIGSKGMDTPKEREYLENASLGKIPFSREAIIKMAEIQEKYARKAYEKAKAKQDRLAKELSPSEMELLNYTLPELPPTTNPKPSGEPAKTPVFKEKPAQAHIDALMKNPDKWQDFEKRFGKGTSVLYLRNLGR